MREKLRFLGLAVHVETITVAIAERMRKNHQPYRDLGADYFDHRNAEQLKRTLIRRLQRLGLQVFITPCTTVPQPT